MDGVDELIEKLTRLKLEKDQVVGDVALRTASHSLQPVIDMVNKSAESKVYGYTASPFAMSKRRYDIMQTDSLEIEAVGNTLAIRMDEVHPLQHAYSKRSGKHWGANVVDVVETGDERFNQHDAGKRPYYPDEEIAEFVEGTFAELWDSAMASFGF